MLDATKLSRQSDGLASCNLLRRNELKPSEAAEAITPKTYKPDFDREVLESFSLADFVETAFAAAPTAPDEPIEDRFCRVREHSEEFHRFADYLLRSVDTLCAVTAKQWEETFLAAGRAATPENIECWHGALEISRAALVVDALGFWDKTREFFEGLTDIERGPDGRTLTAGVLCTFPSMSVHFEIDDDGRLRSESSLDTYPIWKLAEHLRGLLNGAELSRFRRCAYSKCTRIFYAKRTDQHCCSGRCNNNRLQREWYHKPEHGKAAVAARSGRGQTTQAKTPRRRGKP